LSTTRDSGFSSGPYRGLNLGHHVGDDPGFVVRNRALLSENLPAGASIQWLSQVHGTRVIAAGAAVEYPEADASWTQHPGTACAVLTADCLPVLLCDRAGTVVAAAHAGWRGLLAGVLEATLVAMAVDRAELIAWLGPAIGPAAFEVGPEVKTDFLESALKASRRDIAACFAPHPVNKEHYLADLYALARLRLAACGVVQVSGGEYCTCSDPEKFYSYRRDGQTGRMASLIYLNPS
jgi:YfiH family protein